MARARRTASPCDPREHQDRPRPQIYALNLNARSMAAEARPRRRQALERLRSDETPLAPASRPERSLAMPAGDLR